ncbi:MAG: hypothetical protein V1659_03110 [Candidatus Woesearchaeota archaeon]
MSEERKKVLVLEDIQSDRGFYEEFPEFFDCPETVDHFAERGKGTSRALVEEKLRTIPYIAVLVDDYMDCINERRLMENLCDGKYGSLNQEIPTYSIAHMYSTKHIEGLRNYAGTFLPPSWCGFDREEESRRIVRETMKVLGGQ